MALNSSFHLFVSILLFLLPLIFSTSTTIPLTFFHSSSTRDPYKHLSHLASLSISRAHHIKFPQKPSISTTPLAPHSYGAYSISLNFGTPPQSIPFIMDTGSDFVWFPCTKRYTCNNCSVTGQEIPSYIPKASSSVQILGCMNPKCTWIHNTTDPSTRCKDCQLPNSANCKQMCPPYLILYGSGSTSGLTLVETLDLPNKKVPNVVVGCSLFSTHQPAGIAGFGRGVSSIPSQLGIKKFSYCLLSRNYDDSGKSSNLVLDGAYNSGKKTAILSYTPLLKNPLVPETKSLSVYYYVGLRKITVGGQKVKIPYKFLIPDDKGNGGTIVDSGTTLSYMSYDVFESVLKAFSDQVKYFKRDVEIETQIGLKPCFNISGHEKVSFPDLIFHFKGGAEMKLPLANYFAGVGNDVVCLAMVSSNFYGSDLFNGPSIILGSFQMQNYQVEFDLKNERFGFKQQLCK
ncbi:aspartic protease [Lithospermum erythrorhizon]|uniref:Aspartic protease n=1 Tax=Lithospermum erythrorhizon TaxID=34254 RepID=A0AAV3R2Y5_LITER